MKLFGKILSAVMVCSLVFGAPAAYANQGSLGQGKDLAKIDGQTQTYKDTDTMPDYPPPDDDDGFGGGNGGGNDDGPDSTDDDGGCGGGGYDGGSGSDPDGSGGGCNF